MSNIDPAALMAILNLSKRGAALAPAEQGPGAAAAIGSQAAGDSSTLGGLLGLLKSGASNQQNTNAMQAGMGLLTQGQAPHPAQMMAPSAPPQQMQSPQSILGGMFAPAVQGGTPQGLNTGAMGLDPRILQLLMGGGMR